MERGKFHRKCSEQYNMERMKALCFVRAFFNNFSITHLQLYGKINAIKA